MSLAWVLTGGCLLTPTNPVGESSNPSAWLPSSPQPISGNHLCTILLHNQKFTQEVRPDSGSLRHTGAHGNALEPQDLISSNMVWIFSAGSQVPALRHPPPFLSYLSFPQPHFWTPRIPCLTSAVGSEAWHVLCDSAHEYSGSLLAMTSTLKWLSQTHL